MRRPYYILYILLLLFFTACGNNPDSSRESFESGAVSFNIKLARPATAYLTAYLTGNDICIDYGVATVSAVVTDSSSKAVTSGSWSCSSHQGTITGIPSGAGYTIKLEGKDSDNTVTWSGEKTGISVSGGDTTAAGTIAMTYTGSDTTAPAITSTSPSDSAVNVPVTTLLTATFSEKMAISSVNTKTFTLTNGTTPVSGSVTYDSNTKKAIFIPATNLSYSTTYTATVTTGVEDMSGNNMQADHTWSFTTEAPPSTAPSTPTGVSPTAGNGQATITWDAVTSATSYNIYWATTAGVTKITGTKILGITSSSYTHTGLTNGTTYYYVVTAVNSYGESSESSQVSATPASSDTTAPIVSFTSPADNAIGTAVNASVSATFSETMDASTISTTTITLTQGTTAIPGIVTYSGTTATLTPLSSLSRDTIYTATITTGVKDTAGNALVTAYSWSFKSAWTIQVGTSASDVARDIVIDANANIYVVGSTEGNFDGHTSGGFSDVFLIKYDSLGTKQWSKQIGTAGFDSAGSVTLDASGNIYIAGYWSGDGIGIKKFDTYGTLLLSATLFGGGDAVAVDSQGNIYVSSADKLVKANSSGVVQWSKTSSQVNSFAATTVISGLALDSGDNVYITGYTNSDFSGAKTFISDSFIVKYDSSGNKLSADCYSGGAAQQNGASNLIVDSSQNIYVVGYYGNYGNTNLMIYKYNSPYWQSYVPGYGASDVSVDVNGNVYVAGTAYDAGNTVGILIKYNSAGDIQWDRIIKATNTSLAYSVALDSNGNAYVAGQTSGSLDGNINADSSTVLPDAFIVKFNSDGVKQ